MLNMICSWMMYEHVNFQMSHTFELKFRESINWDGLNERLIIGDPETENLKSEKTPKEKVEPDGKVGGIIVLIIPGILYLAYLLAYLFLHHDREASRARVRERSVEPEDSGGEEAEVSEQPVPQKRAALIIGRLLSLLGLAETGPSLWATLRAQFGFNKQTGIVVGVGLLALLVMVPPTSVRKPAAKEIIFVQKGVVSYTQPDYQRYGRAAGGMFGLLPEYSQLFGCKVFRTDPLKDAVTEIPENLNPNQILVLTNLDVDLGKETVDRIWKFVEEGGSLWVLGDHTFLKEDKETPGAVPRNHINDLLDGRVHIKLEHDSAEFFPQGWFHSYRFRQGTPFGDLRDDAENRPGLLVGASLLLEAPAHPFIVGRYAYRDMGRKVRDPEKGFNGNFEFDPVGGDPNEGESEDPERLGDLVLVAGERYGKGRVLVVGDTSSFFSNNMSRSYEFMRASLSWLGDSNKWSVPYSRPGRILATMLLFGFGVVIFLFRSQPVLFPVLVAIGLVTTLFYGRGGQLPFDKNYARQHMAVIDFAHQPNASKHSSMGNGLHGVSINLARYDLNADAGAAANANPNAAPNAKAESKLPQAPILPVTINEWDQEIVDAAGYMVLSAPRKPISFSERREIKKFMKRGGTVILACGYQDYKHCRSFLKPFKVEIGSTPLGRTFDSVALGQNVSFLSSWPLKVDNPDAKIICTAGKDKTKALMVSIPVGTGQLIVIGDSEFLHNRNLEGHESYDPNNTRFIKTLLDYVKK